MKKINAQKAKNWKIDPATALINSLYISKKTDRFLQLAGGGGHGEGHKDLKDTPPEGLKKHLLPEPEKSIDLWYPPGN